MSKMIIGIDFDNTIVDYDRLFYNVALEKGLIPKDIAQTKNSVRDFLRKEGKEDTWTELQGYIYGPRIFQASLFPGVLDFFEYCKQQSIIVYIVSHKTKHPFIGEKHDLHDYAKKFIEKQDFHDMKIGLPKENVFLELTKEEKIDRIMKLKCTHFIDDLPEFLSENGFPSNIVKILFDPNHKHKDIIDFEHVSSWSEVIEKIKLKENGDYFSSKKFNNDVKNLIKGVDSSLSGDFKINPIKGGKNNRVFCIDVKRFGKALLKAYFKHENEPRDRLRNEFSFSKFAWNKGLKCLHQPYADDPENRLGLYGFIEGRKINADEVNEDMVKQALSFFVSLNKNKSSNEAKSLPNASEACFSINSHVDTVKNRVNRLNGIDDSSEINKKAISFVKNDLVKAWERVFLNTNELINEYKVDPNEELSADKRFLSPSDFGFHNAILNNDGKLCFVDFEYAGWDDAAKMICDFFCQPEIPAGLEHFDMFVNDVFLDEKDIKRAKLLLPAYKIKWCCIMLNEFLGHDSERRKFAQKDMDDIDHEGEKAKQLNKVQNYIKDIDKFIEISKSYKSGGI